MDIRYTYEKLLVAVHALVVNGPLEKRLAAALMSIHVLRAKDFPGDLGERFVNFWSAANHGHGIEGSMNALNDREREELASELLDIFTALAVHKAREQA